MTRQRLRPAYTSAELAEVYAVPHDHTRWKDHHVRIDTTVALARGVIDHDTSIQTAADLSCGNGHVLNRIDHLLNTVTHGDFAPGYEITGPLETTLDTLDPVDLYICSETLEHLDDPDLVLRKIRAKARYLLLTTPIDAWDETNPEHYWAWSSHDVDVMLEAAGFHTTHVFNALDMRGAWSPYCFGMWVVS